MNNWYVLTGGPCAGKTTTIDELARRGYPVVAEPARLIIEEKLAAGQSIGEIVTNEDWLPSVVRRSFDLHTAAPAEETVFFDRGIADSIAYYKLGMRELDAESKRAIDSVTYKKIFLLDLVDFKNDEARSESIEEARALHALISQAYESLGYEIVRVAVMPVAERVDYILSHLS
jgi:predicted ATPase